MTLLLAADTCPSCRCVHGQPTDWPTCPDHGHWLYVVSGPHGTGTWTYACQAHGCKHTHTQKEKATMTATNEAATAALAIRQDQDEWSPKQLAALRQLGADDAPGADLEVFFHYCQATGLDPFAKQIRLRKDRQKVKDANGHDQWQNRWSIETEIDGYRVIASRAAKRDGVRLSYGPTYWIDAAEHPHELWLGDDPPAGASLTVYKDGAPFPATVRFKSFAKYTSSGQLMAQWATMPDHMIAKCAEAQALRKAFPHDLNGIRLSDDTPHPAPAPAAEIPATPPPRPRPATRSATNREAIRAAISEQFSRLGLDDPDERGVYVNKLNNKPPGAPLAELTDRELRVALHVLSDEENVPDIAALVELCAPEPTAS